VRDVDKEQLNSLSLHQHCGVDALDVREIIGMKLQFHTAQIAKVVSVYNRDSVTTCIIHPIPVAAEIFWDLAWAILCWNKNNKLLFDASNRM
jgi:hypothetical protein